MPSRQDDADRLFGLLDAEGAHPALLENEAGKYSDDVKDDVVARIGKLPSPSARLLARLPLIRTGKNTPDIVAIYAANLAGADPASRRVSLYELQALGHPALRSFALAALKDTNDQVLFAACMILLPEVKQDPTVAAALRDVCSQHKGQTGFHATVSLLESHRLC